MGDHMVNRPHFFLRQVAKKLRVHPRTIVRWIDTKKVNVEKKKNRQGHLIFSNEDMAALKEYAERIEIVGRQESRSQV